MKSLFKGLLVVLFLLGVAGWVEACSNTFVSSGSEKISARNLDWGTDNPMLVTVSPRGVCRKSCPLQPGATPASWVSQYGTVTVRMYAFGAYVAIDGINEEGLGGGLLMLNGAEYPALDSRPVLGDDTWLFYFLDNCRDVDEAVALAPGVRVDCVVPQHLILQDPTGDAAVMEYVDGSLNIYRPPVFNGVMTNEPPYPGQIANLSNYRGFGGDLPLPGGTESESRFVRASWYHQTLPVPETAEQTVGSALAIMQNIAKPLVAGASHTVWTGLRDHAGLKYSWRSFYHPDFRYLDLNSLDFSEGNPVMVLDLYSDLKGDVSGYLQAEPPVSFLSSGDYDGDGTSDIAIFRGNEGLWSVRGVTRVFFGGSGDLPVSGDYNGDGTAEVGIYRGLTSLWSIRGITRSYFGGSGQPVPGDYDGDGRCDIAVFREATGLWAVKDLTRVYFGNFCDAPVPGDYNGDGTWEMGLYRVGISGNLWAVRDLTRFYFGTVFDAPFPGDYDGDGTWGAAAFGPESYATTNARWLLRETSTVSLGLSTDRPVPADYRGDGADEPAVFRADSGLWVVKDLTRAYFGTSGDLPATR